MKDVDGVYDRDPRTHSGASLIREIGAKELDAQNLETLPFDRALLGILRNTRLVDRFQIVNGLDATNIEAAIRGEHVGTIIHRD